MVVLLSGDCADYSHCLSLREASHRTLLGKVFGRDRVKKRPRHAQIEGLCGENGRNSKEEKNKQVQTNRDLLQETVYQLFDDGYLKVGTSVFTSSVNTLQYVTYSPNRQTVRTE